MAVPYEQIAETRPRIRRDVLFTETPSGVLFHNAHGGFNLTTKSAYRFASLIVPHLNGRHRLAEICQGLGEKQRDMVAELVQALYDRGLARRAEPPDAEDALPAEVAERFAAQVNYVDHYVDGAEGRFRRFRETRVAVLGDDPLARWCVLSLVRNGSAAVGVLPGIDVRGNGFDEVLAEVGALADDGCPVEIARLGDGRVDGAPLGWDAVDGYDVVVVTGGSAGPRQLTTLLAAGVPAGRRLLPAWRFGRRAVLGPLTERGGSGCWACAALRLGANGDAGAAADLWSSVAPTGPVTPPEEPFSRPLAAMLGNLLGYEVFRLTTGALPSETRGQVIVQDLETLDVVAEPLHPHPRCPFCADAEQPVGAGSARPVDLTAADAARRADGSDVGTDGGGAEGDSTDVAGADAAARPDDAADDGPAAGELAPDGDRDADDAAEDAAGDAALAALTAREPLVRPHVGVFSRFADEDWSQTPIKVGTVCLGTGHAERREISAFDVHHVAGARLRALFAAAEVYAEHVIPVAGLFRGPALEAAREKWPLVAPSALATGSGLGAPTEEVAAWAAATSLLDGETALVPAAALRTFGPYNRDRVCEPTRAGLGAGGSERTATERALLSALGHDALLAAVRGTRRVARLRLDDAGGPGGVAGDAELTFLVRSADNLGVPLDLLDLSGPAAPAPVLLARAADPEHGTWDWALGAALSRREAAVAAVRDLLGRVQTGRELGSGARVDTGDPLLVDLDPGTLSFADEAAPDLGDRGSWHDVFGRLRDAGRDALAVPTGTADLAAGRIHVVRAVLTGGVAGDL